MIGQTTAACIVLAGECCLFLELGNRLFGSYVRTPLRALARISLVVGACVLLALPLAFHFVGWDRDGIALSASVLMSIGLIVHFLRPFRFGIEPIPSPAIARSRRALSGSIDIETVTIEAALPGGLDEVRAVVLTDPHCNSESRLSELTEAVSALDSEDYDLLLVLGDLGERAAFLPRIMAMLAAARPRCGVFLVRGNHDCESGRGAVVARLAEEMSVNLLRNSAHTVEDVGISVVGLEHPWCRGPLPERPGSAFSIGLTHTPDNVKRFAQIGVPLVFAGHTHGGMLRLPVLGPLLVPSRYGRFLAEGWFRVRGTRMCVSRGLGYGFGKHGRCVVMEIVLRRSGVDVASADG